MNDVTIEMTVTLEDIYFEKSKQITCQRTILCKTCRGLGAEDPREIFYCQYCKGQGKRIVRKTLPRGIVQQYTATCSVCQGKGSFIKAKCKTCTGRKTIDHEETLILNLKGVKHGDVVTFKGKGDESPGIRASDLIVKINVEKHAVFEAKDDDLVMVKEISLKDALCGFELCVKALDGSECRVGLTDVISPGSSHVFIGKGLTKSGSLIVCFQIVFPTRLDDEKKGKIRSVLNEIEGNPIRSRL